MSFHINPETGEPGPCRANIQCRFGEKTEHYSSAEDARDAYEIKMNEELIESLRSKNATLTERLESRKFTERELEDIGYGRFDNGDGVSFEKEDSYDAHIWAGKLKDGPQDIEIRVVYGSSNFATTSLYVGSERYEVSNEELSSLDGDEYDYSRQAGIALSNSVTAARKKYPEFFDEERNLRIASKAKGYDTGDVNFGGYDLYRTSSVAPEIWESKISDTPGIHECYVRVRHGYASMRIVTDDDTISIHSASISDGMGSFADAAEAGRFFVQAEENFKKFLSDREEVSESQY